jgi:arylsulfatase A-like enzyme
VETFDNAVRIVLDAFERHDVGGRTLVILTSDNGGVSTSEGWPTSNSPFRAGKGWLCERGYSRARDRAAAAGGVRGWCEPLGNHDGRDG